MIVYTLEQRWDILRQYFENHDNVAECVRKLCTDFGRREAPSVPYVCYLVRKRERNWHPHRSQQLNISETSLRRILHKDLGMKPYKVHLIQELKPMDHPMRFRFAKWACDRFTEDTEFGKKKSSFQMKLILILAGM